MNRLAATVRLDLTLQWRNYLPAIVAGVALFVGLLLRQLVPADQYGLAVPVLLLFTLSATGYMFAGGLLLLERGQRTLDALSVTPLRSGEYLAAKTITLTAIGTIESLVILLIIGGTGLGLLPALLGAIGLSVIYTLIGIIVVVRYTSVTDFLLPSILYIALLGLPFIDYLGWWSSPIFYVWPTQGALLLLGAGYAPIAGWQFTYAVLSMLAWIAVFAFWALRAYERHIVRKGVA